VTEKLVSYNTFMPEDSDENKSPHEIARAIHDEVQVARDSALKAHLRFQHSNHTVATEFNHVADHLNHVLANLNRMIAERPEETPSRPLSDRAISPAFGTPRSPDRDL